MATRGEILRTIIEVDTKRAVAQVDNFSRKLTGMSASSVAKVAKVTAVFAVAAVAIQTAAAAVATLNAAVKQLDQFFAEQSKIIGINKGFEVMARRIGTTADVMLKQLRPATQGLINDLDLMKATNQAVLLGIPVTAEGFSELAGKAVQLGAAMGIDARKAIESVTIGLGRMSPKWLDNLGIIIDIEKVNKDVASSLNLTADQLSETQKKAAIYNATLDAMRVSTEGLSSESEDLASVWNVLRTFAENAKKEFFLMGSESGELRDAMISLGITSVTLAIAIKNFVTVLIIVSPHLRALKTLVTLSNAALVLMQFKIERNAKVLGLLGDSSKKSGKNLEDLTDNTDEFNKETEASIGLLEQLLAGFVALREGGGETPLAAKIKIELEPGQDIEAEARKLIGDFTGFEDAFAVSPEIEDMPIDFEKGKEQFDEITRLRLESLRARQEAEAELTDEFSTERFELELLRLDDEFAARFDKLHGDKVAIEDLEKEFDARAKGLRNKRTADEAAEAEKRKQIEIATRNAIIGNLGIIFGKRKEAALANAIINTAEGITTALSKQDYAGAAFIALAGLAEISTITGATIGGGGGSGGGGGVSGGPGGGTGDVAVGASEFIPGVDDAPRQQITIFFDGQVVGLTADEIARTILEPLRNQAGSAGADIEVFT